MKKGIIIPALAFIALLAASQKFSKDAQASQLQSQTFSVMCERGQVWLRKEYVQYVKEDCPGLMKEFPAGTF